MQHPTETIFHCHKEQVEECFKKVYGELENIVHNKKPLPEMIIFILVFLTTLPLLVADVPMYLNCEPFSDVLLTPVI